MTLIVEDGTAPTGADTYAALTTIADYAVARGLTFPTSPAAPAEAAARISKQWLDGTFRSRFPGYRTNGRGQSCEWPRTDAYDVAGEAIGSDEIPQEIIDAQCEAAIRELATPGSMMPDLERGGGIRSLKAGSVAIEYSGNASALTTYTTINGILSGLLSAASMSFIGVAVRG